MNFIIRKAEVDDAKGIAKVHIDSWRTTYREIVSEDILGNLNIENRIERWRGILGNQSKDYRILVAEDEHGQILGFLDGGKNRDDSYDYDAELYAFYLLEHVQKQGVGRKMIGALTEELKSVGFISMIVWVLKDNSARNFYEKMGGIFVDMKYLEGLEVDEVAYGWKDIGSITKRD